MGINATCAIAANELDMQALLEEASESFGEGCLGYLSVSGFMSNAISGKDIVSPWNLDDSIRFEIVRRGGTYVVVFNVTRSSVLLHGLLREIADLMPEGEYGIAYSFAWDHDPLMVTLNTDDEPYTGGGAEHPWHLSEVDYDYEEISEWKNWLRRKGKRIADLEVEKNVQRVAEAEAMRWWAQKD